MLKLQINTNSKFKESIRNRKNAKTLKMKYYFSLK